MQQGVPPHVQAAARRLQHAVVLELWCMAGKPLLADLTAQNEKVKKFVKDRLCIKHLNAPAVVVTEAALLLGFLLLQLSPTSTPSQQQQQQQQQDSKGDEATRASPSLPQPSSRASAVLRHVAAVDMLSPELAAAFAASLTPAAADGECTETRAEGANDGHDTAADSCAATAAAAAAAAAAVALINGRGARGACASQESTATETVTAATAAVHDKRSSQRGSESPPDTDAGVRRPSSGGIDVPVGNAVVMPAMRMYRVRSGVVVQCHAALCLAMHLVMRLQLKVRVLSTLFGDERRAAMFTPLHQRIRSAKHNTGNSTDVGGDGDGGGGGGGDDDDDSDDSVSPEEPPAWDVADGVRAAQRELVRLCMAGIVQLHVGGAAVKGSKKMRTKATSKGGSLSRHGSAAPQEEEEAGEKRVKEEKEGKRKEESEGGKGEDLQAQRDALIALAAVLFVRLFRGSAAWFEEQACLAHFARGLDATAQTILHTLNPSKAFAVALAEVCRGRGGVLIAQDNPSAAAVTFLSHAPQEVEQWLSQANTAAAPAHMRVDPTLAATATAANAPENSSSGDGGGDGGGGGVRPITVASTLHVAQTAQELLAEAVAAGQVDDDDHGDSDDGGSSGANADAMVDGGVRGDDLQRLKETFAAFVQALAQSA